MLEEILDYRNIQKALKQVTSNKGAGGIDGMETGELGLWLETNWMAWKGSILDGSFRPHPVRKVEIPKPGGGGKRMLGIPCVSDRLLQQAIHQWLSPKYESEFSANSYGFREGRNAYQAVLQAQQYLDEGKEWIIELDLEKFFDRVNHDKLMGKLAKRITDKRTLGLIRSFLNSGIMEGGLISARTEGVPQGSPLSPLLSNIVLDDLDSELKSRGHSFVRYADDVSIYVRSEKSAARILETISAYLTKELKLKVNGEKSKVSRPEQSALLGFSFYRKKDKWEIRIAPKSLKRIKEKIRAATSRKDPTKVTEKIKKMEAFIVGWVNYFLIARAKEVMRNLDSMARHRLRMGIWKQWKTPQARMKNLRKLGISKSQYYQWGKSSTSYCRIANNKVMKMAVSNSVLQRTGYVGFFNRYYWKTEHQIKLF
ncbi:group II intron reverse transcriptase/maturase [Flavitalea flava]